MCPCGCGKKAAPKVAAEKANINYKCSECGKVVEFKEDPKADPYCCGKPMEKS